MSDSNTATGSQQKPPGRSTAVLILGAVAIAAAGATAGVVLSDDDSSGTEAVSTTVSIDATTEEVIAVQTALETVGCYPYPADGEYGPHTAAAVKAFQSASGLADDGALSEETNSALEAAAAAGTTVCTSD